MVASKNRSKKSERRGEVYVNIAQHLSERTGVRSKIISVKFYIGPAA